MSGGSGIHREVVALAGAYGEAVCKARADVFERLCYENFQMTLVSPDGLTFWDKAGYLDRVRVREPCVGDPSFGVIAVDMTGDEMARVHCWVDVAPLRYVDHLGFVKVDGRWAIMIKVFRTMARFDAPEEQS